MIKYSSLLIIVLLFVSCADEKAEREKQRKAKQDSILRADSIYKSGMQYKEYQKAKEDSLLQHEVYHELEINDSTSKAEEIQKFKWKHRDPPKIAPKKEDKLPKKR